MQRAHTDGSIATGQRCFHEVIDVIAQQSPDLDHVLVRAAVEGCSHIELDETLIPTARVSVGTERGEAVLVFPPDPYRRT